MGVNKGLDYKWENGKMSQLDIHESPISPLISVFDLHLRIAIVAEGFASLMPVLCVWIMIV